MTIINTNSPLRLDGPMSDGLIEMADARPAGRGDAVHAGRGDEPGLAGRGDRPAERRGAVPRRAGPDRPARARRWSTARSPRTSTCGPGRPAFGTPESVKAQFATRPDGPPLRPAVAVVERDRVERRRRPGGLRGRDGRVGRGHGRRQPALPGRRLARGRADRVVREADHRRRDPPDDVRGAPAARGRRGTLGLDAIAEVGPGRPFLRHGPHARALRDRVLPAARVGLAQLRDVAGRRRADGDRAGEHDLEAAPRRGRAAAARPGRSPRRSTPSSTRRKREIAR